MNLASANGRTLSKPGSALQSRRGIGRPQEADGRIADALGRTVAQLEELDLAVRAPVGELEESRRRVDSRSRANAVVAVG